MLSSESHGSFNSALRKVQPAAKLPTTNVLRDLSPQDVRLLKRRLAEPVEYIASDVFDLPDAARTFLGAAAVHPMTAADDSGVFNLKDPPTTNSKSDDEAFLFLRLNFCRYQSFKILAKHEGRRLGEEAARELLMWERRVADLRNQIVRQNVPLVLAMAKRTRITGVDFSDLISEGNLALLRSVDKFDCARGFRFSTYACRAILKSFSRVAARTARYRGYFPTEFDPTLEKSDHVAQKRETAEGDSVDELKNIIGNNLANLNDVEQQVIKARFALDAQDAVEAESRAKTLEQVGEMIGVTKERVRQIQNKALAKLRAVLDEGVLAK